MTDEEIKTYVNKAWSKERRQLLAEVQKLIQNNLEEAGYSFGSTTVDYTEINQLIETATQKCIESATQKCVELIESSEKKITTLVESETELNEKQSAELAEQNKSIAEQGDVLYAQKEVLEAQAAAIEAQAAAIEKQDKNIAKQKEILEAQSTTITYQNTILEEQSAAIEKQNTTLEEQSAQIEKQNATLAEQSAAIEKQNEILKQQEEAIAKHQEQITSHQDFIDNLESSQLMRDILNKLKDLQNYDITHDQRFTSVEESIKLLQEKEAVVNNTYVTNEYITQVIQEVTDRLDFIENKWCAFFMRGVHAYANGLPKTIYDVEGDEYIIKQGVRCYKDSVGDIYYAKEIADDGTITWAYTGLSFQKWQNKQQSDSERS